MDGLLYSSFLLSGRPARKVSLLLKNLIEGTRSSQALQYTDLYSQAPKAKLSHSDLGIGTCYPGLGSMKKTRTVEIGPASGLF